MKVLVSGGTRSGKSRYAESLLAGRPGVTYVAPGPPGSGDDPEWAARIASHRARRPAGWTTVETRDLAQVLASANGAVLVDSLGTWLTGVLDEHGAWDRSSPEIGALVDRLAELVVVALSGFGHDAVLVTDEVGLGVVPEHRSGRVFRDLLGMLNQQVAAACDEVHLVVAGRVLRL